MSTEDNGTGAGSLEVAYKLGSGGRLTGTRSPIITPEQSELQAYASANAKVCGECKYFALTEGQARIKGQRLVERVTREEGWKAHHLLVSPLNELGICGAHESGAGQDSMVTGTLHAGCDQFVRSRGMLSRTRRSERGGK